MKDTLVRKRPWRETVPHEEFRNPNGLRLVLLEVAAVGVEGDGESLFLTGSIRHPASNQRVRSVQRGGTIKYIVLILLKIPNDVLAILHPIGTDHVLSCGKNRIRKGRARSDLDRIDLLAIKRKADQNHVFSCAGDLGHRSTGSFL